MTKSQGRRLNSEHEAQRILRELGVLRAPVPVEDIAVRLGMNVERAAFGDEVSGVLVIQEGHGVIGVNATHPLTRQRFTIAHEIGHYVLHKSSMAVFIDKQFLTPYRALFRDSASSSGGDHREREANSFAAELLMPTALLQEAIDALGSDIDDDEAISQLAKRFVVSKQAMTFRVVNLANAAPGLLPQSAPRRRLPQETGM